MNKHPAVLFKLAGNLASERITAATYESLVTAKSNVIGRDKKVMHPRPESPTDFFLTIREAAEVLRLHPRTLREYIRRGELEGRLIGGRWRFRRKDLDAFFENAPRSWDFAE